MLLTYVLLAISVSIDSLGIGITYGIRNTKIFTSAKCILFILSVIITSLSIYLGGILNLFLPNFITKYIGIFILIFMGIWIIYQSSQSKVIQEIRNAYPKIYHFFIKSLGITVQIIRNPISSDLDGSTRIDAKEAIYLGIALSLDSIGIGIGGSIIGINSFIFPIFVASFQLFFLSIGSFLGKRISSLFSIPQNIWSILSGILLICIGISRFFI